MKKISEEQIQTICGYIRSGIDFVQAAVVVGFSLEEATKFEQKFATPTTENEKEIRDDIIRAAAHFEILQIQRIIQEGGASGAKWILERRLSDKYSLKKIEGQKNNIPPLLIEDNDFEDDFFKVE